MLKFEGIHEMECLVTKTRDDEAKVPYYGGQKFPLTTFLAAKVREMLADPTQWAPCPPRSASGWRSRSESPRSRPNDF